MTSSQTKSHAIVVRWNDAPIGHFLAHYDNKLSFEYTIDIRWEYILDTGVIKNRQQLKYLYDYTENFAALVLPRNWV